MFWIRSPAIGPRLLASILAGLLVLWGSWAGAGEESVELPEDSVVIATGPWPPYLTPSTEDNGVLARVVRRAFQRAGLKVRFLFHPWPRNLRWTEDGKVDAFMPGYCSPVRRRRYRCSAALVKGEQVFFHRRGMDFDWKKLADLKDYEIGATLAYYYGDEFQRWEEEGRLNVLRIPKDQTNFKLLLKGRIDLFPQDRVVGYAMIRSHFPREQWNRITHHPRPLHREPLHLLFTRSGERGKRFLEIFNRQLAQMTMDGELDRLLAPVRAASH